MSRLFGEVLFDEMFIDGCRSPVHFSVRSAERGT